MVKRRSDGLGEVFSHQQGEGPGGRTRAPLGLLCALAAAFTVVVGSTARAQPPPPGYEGQPPPPPQGYYVQAPPPPYYATPGAYGPPGGYGSQQLGPKFLEWEEGDPIQPGYHLATKIRKGLVIGGAVTFGTTYFLTAFTAALIVETNRSDSAEFTPLFVPAIGPFITIGTAHSSGAGTFVLVLDGLAQSAGLAMLIAGIAAPRTTQVRNDVGKLHVTPVPMTFGRSSAGFGLVGTF